MKTLYIMPQGKVPKVPGALYVRMSTECFNDVYTQYLGYPNPICVVLGASIPYSALLKFIEAASDDFSLVLHDTPDLVLLSRFSNVFMGTKPTIRPFPDRTFSQTLLDECKVLCR